MRYMGVTHWIYLGSMSLARGSELIMREVGFSKD